MGKEFINQIRQLKKVMVISYTILVFLMVKRLELDQAQKVTLLKVSVYFLVTVTSSGILFAKQQVGLTFNFDKQEIIEFIKFIKVVADQSSFGQKIM